MRKRVVLGLVFVVLFALGWWVGRSGASRDLYGNLDLFIEVLGRVEQNYVDPVDPEKLIDGALKGLTHQLDPYSQYLDARAYGNLQTATHGTFGGIGIVVGIRDNYPTVISPIEGGPAYRAGIRTGDVIVKIEGKSSAGLSIDDAADKLRGEKGTSVTISIARDGEPEPQNITLVRDIIVTKSVPYAFIAAPGVGYLRLASFSETSGAEVREGLASLRKQGARSVVLDLRQNPGGLLEQAVDVSNQFLPKGDLVVQTRGRIASQDQRFYTKEAGAESRWPVVVLIDEGSASAAEIVAGALQDLDRALLVGRTSFGKGSVQSVYPLRSGRAALKLTTARYYTPSGRSIHKARADSVDALDALDDDDQAPTPRAPADSTPRPRYTTSGGRVVYGGGGITPDVEVSPDTLGPVARQVERRALNFKFANKWVVQHEGTKVEPRLPEATWSAFVALLEAEKIEGSRAAIERERPMLERGVRRELARRIDGDAAAARVALEGDPVFRRALQVLERARAPRDVFAGVTPAKAPTTATAR